jgi:hypothetical protein
MGIKPTKERTSGFVTPTLLKITKREGQPDELIREAVYV